MIYILFTYFPKIIYIHEKITLITMTNEKKTITTESTKKWYSVVIEKIKWFFSELLAMYSGKSSYFSKKRIESGVAFIMPIINGLSIISNFPLS